MISWIISNWSLLFWSGLVLFVLGSVRYVFGPKVALPLSIAAGAFIMYIIGRKSERDIYRKYAQDIKEKRERAYEEIDNRDTSASDVVDRLRRNGF